MTAAIKAGFIALIFALFLATPAVAGQLEDAATAYDSGDYGTALRIFRTLAGQGDAKAQFSLGFMYHNGEGVLQDYAEAAKWYRKAAEQGDTIAQYKIGLMYKHGLGVPQQDYAEAVKWFRKSAEQGDAKAQCALGFMYHFGEGVPQDFVQAYMWYNLAATIFSAIDNEGRAIAVKGRDILAAKMTPEQIAEAQKLAREWKPEPSN